MRPQCAVSSPYTAFGRFCVLLALALSGAAAHALTISPVLVELSPARRIASITLSNPGDQPISFQAATMAWTQPDGIDRYEESDELVVVPPFAEIPAGGSQIFRVTLRQPAGAREQAYRLIFEDVTAITAPASEEVAVTIRFNHDLPVFAAVAGKPRAEPRLGPCTGAAPAAGGCVRLDNDGNRYVRVDSLTVEGAEGKKEFKVSTRVLAGAWRQWTFDVPGPSTGSVKVSARTSDGLVATELAIPAR